MNSYDKERQLNEIDILTKRKAKLNNISTSLNSTNSSNLIKPKSSAKDTFMEMQNEIMRDAGIPIYDTPNVEEKSVAVKATKKISEAVNIVANKVTTSALLDRSLVDWRPILAQECQVYSYGTKYFAKRFYQINYTIVGEEEAKTILVDNLYALLRFKYFPAMSDEIDERINDIIRSFTKNLATTLIHVILVEEGEISNDEDGIEIKRIPNSCVAFKNGVYDFKNNNWLFKYDIKHLDDLNKNIYMYDFKYAIMWYFNINFEPLPINIMETPLEEFIQLMKDLDKDDRNFAFELIYNIAHDGCDKFSPTMFKHFCEILGYTITPNFVQQFVILMGSGGNGKNSLFDGCFSNRIIPQPCQNSLDDIEENVFITGAIENHYQNIYLETDAKTHTKSRVLKQLTGSIYQTIEHKGKDRYQSTLNCKYIFAGNDQDQIKFSDTTPGFMRRINIFEIYYKYDKQKQFLKKGDYYDTSFSDDLHELKADYRNTIVAIYFAMYGTLSATQGFNNNFRFTENDWNVKYSDIDLDLKETLENTSIERISKYMTSNQINKNECRYLFYCADDECVLHNSKSMREFGCNTYDDLIEMFKNDEMCLHYFSENDVFMNLKILQNIIKLDGEGRSFNVKLKKLYPKCITKNLHNNKSYILVSLSSGRLKIKG